MNNFPRTLVTLRLGTKPQRSAPSDAEHRKPRAHAEEHGRDHSCIVGVVQVVGGPLNRPGFPGGSNS